MREDSKWPSCGGMGRARSTTGQRMVVVVVVAVVAVVDNLGGVTVKVQDLFRGQSASRIVLF